MVRTSAARLLRRVCFLHFFLIGDLQRLGEVSL